MNFITTFSEKIWTAAKSVLSAPFSILKWLAIAGVSLTLLSLIWFAAALVRTAFGTSPTHPWTAFFSTLTVAILTSFAFYVYRHGGAKSLLGGKDSVAAKPAEPPRVEISYSDIRGVIPADKWIVAEVRGTISASVSEPRSLPSPLRKMFGEVEYRLKKPVNVLYKYFVPLTDNRMSASFDSKAKRLKISLPDVKLDLGAIQISDLSQLEIETDNVELFVSKAQKAALKERLKKSVQQKYDANGMSDVCMKLAEGEAKRSIVKFFGNLLWTRGETLDSECVVEFEWLPDTAALEQNRAIESDRDETIDVSDAPESDDPEDV